uniref:SDR family NAD(P)-dependent oxidoreductase n=1 Tax=Shewanella sp. TaxID=50422 RepID=UPI0040481280
MKRVLLTGGIGYIGSHAAAVLAEAGFDVVLYDNLSNSKRSVLDRLESITGVRFPFVEGDVRDTTLLEDTLRAHQSEAVIHFAGLKAVGESVEQPLAYYDNNVVGTFSLTSAMQNVGVGTLVFSGSATVYGDPQVLPIDEEHPTSAINPYGQTKLHIEGMLLDLAKSDPNWRISCLRYFNPVGAHESGLIGE